MSVETKQIVTLEDGTVGTVKGVALESGEIGKVVSHTTEIRLVCDFEGCTKGIYTGIGANNEPVRVKGRRMIEWKDDGEVPPEVFSVLSLIDWDQAKKVFCCANCLVNYLNQDYVLLKPKNNVIAFPAKVGE